MSSRCSWCPVVVLKLGECWWSPWRLQHPSPRSFFSPRIDTVSTCIMKILSANSDGRWIFIFFNWFSHVFVLVIPVLWFPFLVILLSFKKKLFIFLSYSHPARVAGSGADLESLKASLCTRVSFLSFIFSSFVIFFCRYFFHFPVTTQRQQNDNKMTTLIRLIQNCKPEWQKHDNKMAKYLF